MKNIQPTGKIEWIRPELIVDISKKQHSIEGKYASTIEYDVYGPS